MPSGHPNPNKLKPLSGHAWEVLRALQNGPLQRHHINAGVSDRFYREALAEVVTIDGRLHVQITDAGLAKLKERP